MLLLAIEVDQNKLQTFTGIMENDETLRFNKFSAISLFRSDAISYIIHGCTIAIHAFR